MNLIIDIGNSYAKYAIFSQGAIILKGRILAADLLRVVDQLKGQYPKLANTMVASVGEKHHKIITYLKQEYRLIQLSEAKLPFQNQYKTPKTLGQDRIALVSAAVQRYPGHNCLIIDAGSCITYDFVDRNKVYLGGAISPGLKLRYKALHNFTARLPLLEPQQPQELIGASTEESIHTGVVLGIQNEIDGQIKAYRNKYPDLTVILTGGDVEFLSNQLKSSIFAHSNFLLEGLNFILDYNSKE